MPWFHQRPNLLTMYGSLTPPPFQRRFTPLAAAGMQYYDLNTPFVATGDFEISVDVYLPDYTNQALLGSTSSNETLRMVDSDTIRYQDATGLSLLNLDAHLPVNQLITLTFTRVGQVISASSSSGQSGSKDLGRAEDSITFTAIASNNGFNFPTGYIANVSLQTAGDNRLYKLDENFGETSVAVDSIGGNNATAVNISESPNFTQVADGWEGVERWTFGTIVPDGTAPAFSILAGSGSALAPETIYNSSISWVNMTGKLRLLVGNSTHLITPAEINGTGSMSAALNTATGTRLELQDLDGGNVANSVNVTAKEFLEVA